MGSQRRECLSFSSRPVLFLVPYLFSPSLSFFPLLVLECLGLVVCH